MYINGINEIFVKRETAYDRIEREIREEAKRNNKDAKWVEREREIRGIA